MDHPAARSLMETVRKINEMGRRARLSDPEVADYLRALTSDPTTEWFTELLREKNEELTKERDRADQLASALRAWYRTKHAAAGDQSADAAELQLVNLLRTMEILNP
jgi:AraC-like DNA-binding protein